MGFYNGGDLVWLERKVGKFMCWDGEVKKVDSRLVWSDMKLFLVVMMVVVEGGNRVFVMDGGSVGGRMIEGGWVLGKGVWGDGSSNGKKSLSGVILGDDNECGG